MDFQTLDLGLIDFAAAYNKQQEIFNLVKSSKINSALLICRHHPVITLGRASDKKNILASRQELRDKGIGICYTERGGDVTFHGPGQIVAYPIFNLAYLKKDIRFFLNKLEETAISFLSGFKVSAKRKKGLTGVWVANQKISSIGIAIRNWITFHGISINIKESNLEYFRLIRPCGMDIALTSLETVLGRDVEMGNSKAKLIESFKAVFG